MDFERIWDRYASRLQAFIRSRVSNDAEADDVLQQVFLRVHRNLCCLPAPEKMEAWIYQITRNLIIDTYRSRRPIVALSTEIADEDDPFARDAASELAGSLRETIDSLPAIYRDALLLTEYEGLSQVELAERLNLSVSAAKSRVQRARRQLRDLILTCCHVELDRRGHVIDFYQRCCCCNPTPA
ncbi:MAG TPA: RNA polymerase sigma factor SigZ [Anaerolineales bacterium]|nr:RNA polymerase sigma factor SigZ [Anaerolineales bacterium]